MTGGKRKRVLVFGDPAAAATIARRLEGEYPMQFEYVGFYDESVRDGHPSGGEGYPARDFDGASSQAAPLLGILEETDAEVVFCATPLRYASLTDVTLRLSPMSRVDFRFPPEVYERTLEPVRASTNGFFGSLSLREPNLSPWHRRLKRAMDIVLSLLMLIVCAPILLVVPILIKLFGGGGPVFHIQIRAGQNGYPFRLYKFRSMVANAEQLLSHCVDLDAGGEPVFKLVDDPRVTAFGKALRRTSIDELPQIFNVLLGEMSWVGPRPEEVHIVQKYNGHQRQRLRARPGVTGLQQTRCRGVPSMEERMVHDLDYIENQTLWMDLKILMKSVFVVLSLKEVRWPKRTARGMGATQ
jgi:exopolysaccharide biosynthesis polyprenyl glycosylphosphotransferase